LKVPRLPPPGEPKRKKMQRLQMLLGGMGLVLLGLYIGALWLLYEVVAWSWYWTVRKTVLVVIAVVVWLYLTDNLTGCHKLLTLLG